MRAREAQPGNQIFAGRTAGLLIGLLYGVHYTDMAALRAIRRDTLLTLGMRELTYGWNLEMQMWAARSGLRVLELPVAYRRRKAANPETLAISPARSKRRLGSSPLSCAVRGGVVRRELAEKRRCARPSRHFARRQLPSRRPPRIGDCREMQTKPPCGDGARMNTRNFR